MDETRNKSVAVEKRTFDCIAPREDAVTQIRENRSSSTQNKHSMISRHLQEDRPNLYTVISPLQAGFIDDASAKESDRFESQCEISDENPALLISKQRRHGVIESDASSDQRQRKRGIAEDKESVSDRTFLRVLHKKF